MDMDDDQAPLLPSINSSRKDKDPEPTWVALAINSVFITFFRLLFKHRWATFLIWLLSLPIAGFFTIQFLNNTSLQFAAPEGTQAYDARMAFNANFEDLSTQGQMVILAQGKSILNQSRCSYLSQLSAHINQSLVDSSSFDLIEGLAGPYWLPDALVQAAAFFGTDIRAQFVNADQTAATLVVLYKMTGQKAISPLLRNTLKEFSLQNCSQELASEYSADVTGLEAMMDDLTTSIESDAQKMDFIALPLALIIFWLFLQNVKLLLLPLFAIVTSLLYAMALMYPISVYWVTISNLAPTVMTSICLAVSTDYTLFLLTRFNEERKTKDVYSAIANMIFYAGHVIITSGLTLAITFAAMLFYPTDFLKSFGIGTLLAVLCSIFINLTISPTLLLCFPNFFTTDCFNWKEKCLKKPEEPARRLSDQLETLDEERELPKELIEQRSNLWFKWVKFWDTPMRSIALIILVLAVTLPVAYFVKDLETTTDSNEVFASNSEAVAVMTTLKQVFNPGVIAPYRLMTVAKNKTAGIITQRYFNISQDFYNSMNSSGLAGKSQFVTVTSLQGIPLTAGEAETLLDPAQAASNPFAVAYQYVANQLLNANRTAALTTIVVDFDPMSRSAEGWLANTRKIVSNFSSTYPDYEFYLYGGAVEVVDLVSVVSKEFPYQVGATCVILFLIMGLVFRSVLIPIRGLLTIGLSVAWTFGLSVLIFEKWLQTPLYWFTPIFSFSIVVGLGLDYDIFLLSRIYEFRDAGFSTNASIVKGTYMTGYIITGAGVIMIMAFISLCVTHVPMILQFAVILSSAVLLDTFVVRTALVPAIMRLCSYINWWPSKFGSAQAEQSSGTYNENYFLDEELEERHAGDSKDVYFVRPHDAKVFFARRRAVRDIIDEGLPDFYSCYCFKKPSGAASVHQSTTAEGSRVGALTDSRRDLSRSATDSRLNKARTFE